MVLPQVEQPPPRSWRRFGRLAIGLALSALFTWLALRGLSARELGVAIGLVDVTALPAVVALTYLIMALRAVRWRLLLLELGRTTRWEAFVASIIGYAVNYIIPIRLGEVVRAYLVASHRRYSRTAAFGTVVVERVIDALCVVAIFVGASLLVDLPPSELPVESAMRAGAFGLLVIGALGGVGLWLVRRHQGSIADALEGLGARGTPLIGRLAGRIRAFAGGITLSGTPRRMALFVLQTTIIWLVTVAQLKLLADAFGFALPWGASWMMLVGVTVGVTLPSAPGMIGTFHYSVMIVLLAFGIDHAAAVAYAVVLHAATVLPVLALGLLFALVRGLPLRSFAIARLRRENAVDRA